MRSLGSKVVRLARRAGRRVLNLALLLAKRAAQVVAVVVGAFSLFVALDALLFGHVDSSRRARR